MQNFHPIEIEIPDLQLQVTMQQPLQKVPIFSGKKIGVVLNTCNLIIWLGPSVLG
jgi:hypothetical protein